MSSLHMIAEIKLPRNPLGLGSLSISALGLSLNPIKMTEFITSPKGLILMGIVLIICAYIY